MLVNLSFIFDPPIVCKAAKYIGQSEKSYKRVFTFFIPHSLVSSLLIGRLRIYVTPGMTIYGMMLALMYRKDPTNILIKLLNFNGITLLVFNMISFTTSINISVYNNIILGTDYLCSANFSRCASVESGDNHLTLLATTKHRHQTSS